MTQPLVPPPPRPRGARRRLRPSAPACASGSWAARAPARRARARERSGDRVASGAGRRRRGGGRRGGRESAPRSRPSRRRRPSCDSIRVVAFQGLSLEASTAPRRHAATARRRAASPARRRRSTTRGSALRAAVETNRQEGAARKAEIEVERRPDGGLALAAPIERDGAVTGVLLRRDGPRAACSRPGPAPGLDRAPGRPFCCSPARACCSARGASSLNLTAAVLIVAALAGYGRYLLGALEAEMRATEAAVADADHERSGHGQGVLAALRWRSRGGELKPAGWDSDVYRRPLGRHSDDGRLDQEKLRRGARRGGRVGDARRRRSRGRRAGGPPLRRPRCRVAAPDHAAPAPARLRLRRAGDARHDRAGLLPVLLRDRAVVHRPEHLQQRQAAQRDLGGAPELHRASWATSTSPSTRADGLVFNYQNFYWTLGFTIVWTITNVSIGVSVGLLLALVLNTRGLAFRPIYRVLLILPWAMPNYITALDLAGDVPPAVRRRQPGASRCFGGQPIAWFDSTFTSFAAVVATNGWLSLPVHDGHLPRRAAVDPGGPLRGRARGRRVPLAAVPQRSRCRRLKPALVPAVILSVIWTFNMFNIIYLVSGGEPRALDGDPDHAGVQVSPSSSTATATPRPTRPSSS